MSKCVICQKDILGEDKKFMMAFEVPYLNLYTHYRCWEILAGSIGITAEQLSEILKNEPLIPRNKSIITKNRKKMV